LCQVAPVPKRIGAAVLGTEYGLGNEGNAKGLEKSRAVLM
jgi:hypothetical protein